MGPWLVFGAGLASVFAGVLAVCTWLWANRLHTSAPGPPTLPLLGNALHFYRQPFALDRIGKLYKQYGNVFRFYVGPKLVVVVTQPEDIKQVLITCKQQERDPYFTRLIKMLIGNGLLTNSKETWKRHRKLIEPAFHFEVLQKHLDTINEGGLLLCENLTAAGRVEVDVYPVLCLHTVRVAMSAIGGVEFDRLETDACSQAKLVADIFKGLKLISKLQFMPWKTTNGTLWMTFQGRELKRLIKVCKNFTQRYLDVLGEQICGSKGTERTHWTGLHSEGFVEKTEIENLLRDEILTLLTTGSETTAGSMGYSLALLALYPEWQEKAQRELEQVFGHGGDFLRPVTLEDLSQLTVIDAIIKESLRLFPTVPILPRLVDQDIPLAGGRYVAPRGCCVFVVSFLTHRHPELFPDPDKFDPGRFLPGGSATSRRSYSYLPFGTGPRMCVGTHLATMEMKILLATVLRRFHVISGSSREELEVILYSITSHPITGCRISFVPREISTT